MGGLPRHAFDFNLHCRLGSWRSTSPRHARLAALLAGPPAFLHACVLVCWREYL